MSKPPDLRPAERPPYIRNPDFKSFYECTWGLPELESTRRKEPKQLTRRPLVRDDPFEPLPPKIERRSLLEIVAMPVVHGGDARLDVVEDLRHDQPGHTRADHETGGGAPQIVAPKVDAGPLDEALDRLLRVRDADGMWGFFPSFSCAAIRSTGGCPRARCASCSRDARCTRRCGSNRFDHSSWPRLSGCSGTRSMRSIVAIQRAATTAPVRRVKNARQVDRLGRRADGVRESIRIVCDQRSNS